MSLRWPTKDPNETLDYSLDWSRFLYDGTNIISVVWYIDVDGVRTIFPESTSQQNLSNLGTSNTTRIATINLGGGNLNQDYKLTCVMTDSTGSTAVKSVKIRIRYR